MPITVPLRGSPLPACLVAALLVAASGCTIGPDQFDYTGPVPNGSPPHNDFRARSNGILPLGAAPRPFPPLVDEGKAAGGGPASGGDPGTAATGVLVAAAAEPLDEGPAVVEDGGTPTEDREADVPAPSEPVVDAAGEPAEQSVEPPSAPLVETPGWRPRD